MNDEINRIHERALRIAYKDNVSCSKSIILMGNSVTVHQRKNLQLLMIEICKTRHDLDPSFMKHIFEEKKLIYNLRGSDKLQVLKTKATGLGTDTVRFMCGGYGRQHYYQN